MQEVSVSRRDAGEQTGRRSLFRGWRLALCAVVCALLVTAVLRSTVADVFSISSGSMEPLLRSGDRVLVDRTAGSVERGDVVVFDGRGSFAPFGTANPAADAAHSLGRWVGAAGADNVYIKRVIGTGGDWVRCCTEGQVTVNGAPLSEPYVYPGDAPSATGFDVVIPHGKLWVMGDHRSESFDSRALLGAPGGGLISEDRVIGRAVRVLWPPAHAGALPAPAGQGQPQDIPRTAGVREGNK